MYVQVNLITIAEAFFVLFEQESEDGMYWLFSNFIKKLESLLTAKEDMVSLWWYYETVRLATSPLPARSIQSDP